MSDEFVPGQRWINNAELQMGLGTVLSSDARSVTMVFLTTGETRTYARASAPLTRVAFAPGDTIQSHEGWTLKISEVREHQGLFTYVGQHDDGTIATLPEGELDTAIQLNRPADRLLTGQVDSPKWFDLRYRTRTHLNRLAHSDLYGLLGGRTSLIPHQLYIAHEVANRYAPRVLLADEVGLGKTIEAGLILHQQLLTDRAQRILIVVPETLVHQWLVEMLRRFNLYFSVFDETRCQAIEESTQQQNPFHAEQLVLCSLDFLVEQEARFMQALDGDWDLLVVDEAHHLQWSPQQASHEYQLIEQLAGKTRGVLLLTATPEQLGKESHFARLRLLDPDRFPDFEKFVEEEKHYEPVAEAVDTLLTGKPLDHAVADTLSNTISEGDNQAHIDTLKNTAASDEQREQARLALVEHMLDRHGTGRVLFRNTRAAVKGFPKRQSLAYPLPLPEPYQEILVEFQLAGLEEAQLLLSPELLYNATRQTPQPHWTQIDPRIEWLASKLKSLKPQKVLVITASAETALDIAEHLYKRSGVHAAVFHEGLSIIERDRAAAYFADMEGGSQVLICSEIGSEGRNFQFAHHLVLFDLPLNPDLLEQRIGRLDRIGQHNDIEIHIPYLEKSAQQIMHHWYEEGLNAFANTCPAGHTVFTRVRETLIEALHQLDDGLADLPALISTTKTIHDELNATLHRGRDRLLEYNSCRPHVAEAIKGHAKQQDADTSLASYLDGVFDCYGIDTDVRGTHGLVLNQNEYMQTPFPGLSDDGMTITYHRDTALANEDMHFVTWEHPLVTNSMENIVTHERGNTAMVAMKCPGIKAGTLLIEALYILESSTSTTLQVARYLPQTSLRVVLDQSGKDYQSDLAHETISQAQQTIKAEAIKKIIRAHGQQLRKLIALSDKQAQRQAPAIIQQAHQQAKQTLGREIGRLQALQSVNPNVRDEEIEFYTSQLVEIDNMLEHTVPRLDALRIIIAI